MATVTCAMASSLVVAPSPLKPKIGFGIKGVPALQQFRKMRVCNYLQDRSASSSSPSQDEVTVGGAALAGAVFAAAASADSAFAAQQVMELAAADNRGAALLIPLLPAIGWVLYNILQPALNQFDRMRSIKGLAIGLGLGVAASVVCASQASALQEIATIADSDSRGLLLLVVLVPAVGWVLFNILQPALSQLNKMRASKAIVGGLGLGTASMLLAPHADGADEIASLAADSDSRGLLLLIVLVPAIGWVLFNILQPALSQLNKMRSGK